MNDCIFCKIAAGEIPSHTVYEDEEFRAILDLGPATEGHTLILPKAHYADITEMPDELLGRAMQLAKHLSVQLIDTLHADGLNVVQNNGETAGQTVRHFHIHLIPRYAADGQRIGWVPGKPTEEELSSTLERITHA